MVALGIGLLSPGCKQAGSAEPVTARSAASASAPTADRVETAAAPARSETVVTGAAGSAAGKPSSVVAVEAPAKDGARA
ncbi:MAG TPA: hypothetical protein VF516_10115, partial [Kofleriaceae bacterium]